MIIDPSISYARESFPRFVRELKDFVRFPSVSAQPQHAGDVRECAKWLGAHLKQIGVEQVQIVATKGHPIVLGQWCHLPGQATLLIYGHYDATASGAAGRVALTSIRARGAWR